LAEQRPAQFKITDPDERIVAGWASVEIIDLQRDIIPVDVLERAMYKYMDRGGYILYRHSNIPVGKVLRWEIRKHPETGKLGVWIEAKIFDKYETDNMVWQAIKEGKIKGFSIGGIGKEQKVKVKTENGEEEADLITDIELEEISLVEEPANPLAKIEQINWYAKGLDVKRMMKTVEWYEDIISGKRYIVEVEQVEVPTGFAYIVRIRKPETGEVVVETEPFNTEDEALTVAYEMLEEKEGITKMVPIQKPFAGFKNFDECVETMRKRGYDKESARRICGWLYWQYEGGKKKSIDELLTEYAEKKKKIMDMLGINPYNLPSAVAKKIERLVDAIIYIPRMTYKSIGADDMPRITKEKLATEKKPVKEEEVTEVVAEPEKEHESEVIEQTTAQNKAADTEKPEIKPEVKPKTDIEDRLARIEQQLARLVALVEEGKKRETAAEEAEKAIKEVSGEKPGLGKELREKIKMIKQRRKAIEKKLLKAREARLAKISRRIDRIEKALVELTDVVEKLVEKIEKEEKPAEPVKKDEPVKVEAAPAVQETVKALKKAGKPATMPRPPVVSDITEAGDRVEIIRKILRGEARPIDIIKKGLNK